MRKLTTWKNYSHLSRINHRDPDAKEFREIFSGQFSTGRAENELIKWIPQLHPDYIYPRTEDRLTPEIPHFQGRTISSRQLTLSIALEENKLRQEERSLICAEWNQRIKSMKNTEIIFLLNKWKLETAYLAHTTDITATITQLLDLELRARTGPTYARKSSAIIGRITKEREKEQRKELKQARLRQDSNDNWNAIMEMNNLCTKRESIKKLLE